LAGRNGNLTPQQLVALSGLLTYQGKSIGAILQETRAKGQDINKKLPLFYVNHPLKDMLH